MARKVVYIKAISVIAIVSIFVFQSSIRDKEELNVAEKQTSTDVLGMDITWINSDESDFILRHEYTGDFNRYVVEYLKDNLTYPLVINKESGEVIKTAKYDGIYNYTEGLAAVYYADRKVLDNGKHYTIDNYRCGFIDTEGKEVIPTIYERAFPFSEGLAEVERRGKFGYIDHLGRVVIPFEYESSQPFRNGYAAVKKIENGKEVWGIIDKKGDFKELEGITGISAFTDGIARAWREYEEIFIDVHGKEVEIPDLKLSFLNKYSEVRNFKEGRAIVSKSDYPLWQTKYGVVDGLGTEIIPIEFSYIYDYCEGMTSAVLNLGKSAYFDIDGKKTTPFKYDYTRNFHEGAAVVGMGSYKDGSLVEGAINKHGNEIVPLIFNDISDIYDGYALVGLENGDNENVKTSKKIGILKLPDNYDNDDGSTKFIKVFINDKEVFFDQDPIIYSNNVLVPIRAAMESMDADVVWDEKNKVTVTKDNTIIEIAIGEEDALVDGERVKLDVPAQIISGRTLVPIRFIAKSLNYSVDWKEDTQTVIIVKE